jgi:hypothetical protein
MENILTITEVNRQDDTVTSYQYFQFTPQIGSNLNNPGEIVINVFPQDEYMHLAESYLTFEGVITKHDGSPIVAGDKVTFANNGIMYLFRLLQFQLNGSVIESIYSPGQATTMMKLLKNTRDSSGLLSCWEKDTSMTLTTEANDGMKIRHAYTTVTPVPQVLFHSL